MFYMESSVLELTVEAVEAQRVLPDGRVRECFPYLGLVPLS
jgi:hypothetical protein